MIKRNNGIDILRLLCAFLVVCIHARFPGVIGEYIKAIARIAVPFFFICSGYLFPANLIRGESANGNCNKLLIFNRLSELKAD